jgi:vancomycin permeability regulator SanA
MSRRRKKVWRFVVGILLVWLFLHMVYITIDGLCGYDGSADMAVVLGNLVYSDGSLSPVLRGRVDRALELYQRGRVARIMVSGGMGEQGKDPGHYPEGLAMKQYLMARGVPSDRIFEDNHGENTYLTAKDFLPVADSLHVHSVIVVSSFYHITRSKYIFRKLGFRNVHGDASRVFYWNDLLGLPRDTLAFYKYLLAY